MRLGKPDSFIPSTFDPIFGLILAPFPVLAAVTVKFDVDTPGSSQNNKVGQASKDD